MLKNFLKLFIILSCFSPLTAQAISKQKATKNFQDEFIAQNPKPLKVKGNAISWEVFAKTKETEKCIIDKAGFDYCLIKPTYDSALKVFDKKEVTLMGFMFPLQQSEKQTNFLLGPYPMSCPFHYHTGPSQIVEVIVKEPVNFSYDPITLKGILTLHYNDDTGVFYYLSNAKKI